MEPLRTIIVEDIRPIRTELKMMLSDYPEIRIVGEAATAAKAITLISELDPEVVLLDIHLPGMSGFDMLDQVKADLKVIFITAYFNEYSAQVQKYNPVDLLTKPIGKDKLSKAIKKLSETLHYNISG